MPRPSERPISGRRFGPNTSRITRSRMTSSVAPIPNGMRESIAVRSPNRRTRTDRVPCRYEPGQEPRKNEKRGRTKLALLELKNLHVGLEDGTEIVKGVDLAIDTNQVHAVMGPNGSGKSTLAYALMGHPAYVITDGELLFDGANLLEMAADERAQRGLFLAFQ